MKKSLYFAFFSIFAFLGTVFADIETLNWVVGDQIYATTTCESGDDVMLPTAPTKYGYDFVGWEILYTPIKYIELTGSQKIIITGYKTTDDSRILLSIKTPDNAANNYSYLFAENGQSGYLFGTMLFAATASNRIRFDYNKTLSLSCDAYSSFENKDITIDFNNNHTGSVYDDNNNVLCSVNFTAGVNQSKQDFALLGKVKIYNVKIYNGNNIVYDLIPVLDVNDTPCLYDKMGRKFYYSSTGAVVAGPSLY